MQKPFYWARCHTCRCRHPIYQSPNDVGVASRYGDFENNHRGHVTDLVPQAHTYDGVWGGGWTDLIRKAFWKPAYAYVMDAWRARGVWTPNADVKEAFQAIQTLTITNLSGKTVSVTTGWQSDQVDNTSNLYLGSMMQFTNTAVNTAAAGSKAVFFFAFGGNASGVLTNFGAAVTGTAEAALTFPSVTANPVVGLVYVQPYQTQNIAMASLPFPMEAAFGNVLPSYWGVAAVNDSGMTLGTTTMKYQGNYNTVV